MNRIKTLWESYSGSDLQKLEVVNQEYREFLDQCKTERECVRRSVRMASAQGYRPLTDYIANGLPLRPGDKVYSDFNGKSLILFSIGTDPIERGMNILGAHIDSPRIDIKQNPVYEDSGFVYLDTHYYGGIKKYQWVTIPLSIHGVVIKKDGTHIDVVIGESDDDPIFAITDLLIHLSGQQLKKTADKVIEGEQLDLLVGSIPAEGSSSDDQLFKNHILQLLKEKYDFEEDDFRSAELEIVPSGKSRELGFDRSMIMAYGQDDRICAFTSLKAMLEITDLKRTSCCILTDKEEVGSVGASGMYSRFFENTTAEVLNLMGFPSDISLRRTLQNSTALSSDVNAGYDPLYSDVFEAKNAAYLGRGVVLSKYKGSPGKSGSNDADPEFLAAIRRIMDENGVLTQSAETGKVDYSRSGTIASIMANYGMNVIDCGLAVLCMHAPMEISSKADIYEATRAYKAFLSSMTRF